MADIKTPVGIFFAYPLSLGGFLACGVFLSGWATPVVCGTLWFCISANIGFTLLYSEKETRFNSDNEVYQYFRHGGKSGREPESD